MRKFKRSVARARMERQGHKRINATNRVGRARSFFAENWRKFI